MDTKTVGFWAFFLGMLLAITTAFFDLGAWSTQVLIVLGMLAGGFHQKIKEERIALGVIYIVLSFAAHSMNDLLLVGSIISEIVSAWVQFLGPVVITTFMIWGGAFLVVNKGGPFAK